MATEDKTAQTELMDATPGAIGGNALMSIVRAEIDIQVSTAHQYPRSMQTFKRRALEMVTLDEETAQSCIYRRPVGKKGGQVEYAEGKSIRMAEIVGACYGNLRVQATLVEQTPRFVRARGVAHDLESNFAASSEVIESTVKADGTPFSERMAVVVAKAALSKARRDATFMVVPGALCKAMEEAARTTAIGTTATLGKRRSLVLDWLNKIGVEPARVFAALGINGVDDIGLEQLETLTGIKTALKDQEITLAEAFPPVEVNKPMFTKVAPKPEPAASELHPPTATDQWATAKPAELDAELARICADNGITETERDAWCEAVAKMSWSILTLARKRQICSHAEQWVNEVKAIV